MKDGRPELPSGMLLSQHISDDWEMVTHGLQTRAIHECHTGSNIADLLKMAMEEWGIQDKDPAIVTNNTSNMTFVELFLILHFKCFHAHPQFVFAVCTKIASCPMLAG